MTPLKRNGITHNDASTKSEILNGQFLSAYTTEETSSFADLGSSNYPDAPEITVHPNGVRKLLKKLKPHKASCPDDISPRILKEMAETLTPVLTLIFKASLNQGKVPDDWKEVNVSPIFKKGDTSQPGFHIDGVHYDMWVPYCGSTLYLRSHKCLVTGAND